MTVCESAPTCREKFTWVALSVCKTTPGLKVLLNPSFLTSTSYVPGVRVGITYNPDSSVMVDVETFVSTFLAVTAAAPITLPEVSVTVPVSVDEAAKQTDTEQTTTKLATSNRTRRDRRI